MTTDPRAGSGSAVPEPEPVCPRHPDLVAYVRCQRCERPTCPQCQRPAAVGIQCVDCVREGRRTGPAVRTTFGGTVRGGRPAVTVGVITACVAVYVAQLATRNSPYPLTYRFDFVPAALESEPWRVLTSAFLHSPGQILHIVFNMYALWLTGPYLEQLLGRARFLALYLLSAVGGSVVYFALADPGNQHSWYGGAVGASGAVFGLFAAFVVVNRRLGRESGPIIGVILINAVIGFLPGLGIAWQAHLGGLVTGAACALVLAYAPRDRRTAVQVGGLVAILVALAVLTMVKIATLPADLPV